MYMPLVAAEDGIVQFVKQPGVSLEPGDILGILTLDDPARVKHAKPFEGLLPDLGHPSVVGNKPHQRFMRCLGILNDILDGFDNQAIMHSTLKELIDVLHDPELPYSEVAAILSSLSGRMPSKLEDGIRAAIDAAKSKTDAHHDFPTVRIKKVLEHYVQDHVLPQDRAMFRTQLGALYDVLERFTAGLKGHETETIANLLARHEQTEKLFGGSIEARVLALREEYKDDLDKVIGLVLSHIKAPSKVKLVLALLDYVKSSGLSVSKPDSRLYKVLQSLALLETKSVTSCFHLISTWFLSVTGRSSVPVSLKAREVLIVGQMPSYEERLVQMEAVLKASVTKSYYGEQGDTDRYVVVFDQ